MDFREYFLIGWDIRNAVFQGSSMEHWLLSGFLCASRTLWGGRFCCLSDIVPALQKFVFIYFSKMV
jgi:hypothetical protein